jgi:hypothetical protein
MLSFIVFRLHFKSKILKGKLKELTPGINYYITTKKVMIFLAKQIFGSGLFFQVSRVRANKHIFNYGLP